jgi:carbonic anhydrase
MRLVSLIAPLCALVLGCASPPEIRKTDASPDHAGSAAHSGKAQGHGVKPPAKPAKHAEAESASAEFAVPFVAEAQKDAPLARARAFLGEALADNHEHMDLGSKHFLAFAKAQAPRATVVTCADSRVQSQAFDKTPANDAFTIRNIGNQVGNALGSVEYGIEHLNTPVLLIVGHTGCGAVKAAMTGIRELSNPIQAELGSMAMPKAEGGNGPDDKAWAEAVILNVHQQVDAALQHFGPRVKNTSLTVVGAVYDFRDDLDNGYGNLTVVNVNGRRDDDTTRAFVEALGGKPPKKREPVPAEKSEEKAADKHEKHAEHAH